MDVDLERPVWPTPDVEEAEPGHPVSSKDRQSERRAVVRSRRALGVACLITAGVPIALIISLWRNLTLPFWYNEQWRAYYISKPGNWWSALKTDGGPFPAGWYFLERGVGLALRKHGARHANTGHRLPADHVCAVDAAGETVDVAGPCGDRRAGRRLDGNPGELRRPIVRVSDRRRRGCRHRVAVRRGGEPGAEPVGGHADVARLRRHRSGVRLQHPRHLRCRTSPSPRCVSPGVGPVSRSQDGGSGGRRRRSPCTHQVLRCATERTHQE